MDEFLRAAIDEARRGLVEGGIPIGSVLVVDGEIIGRGHNQRIQKRSAVLHAEMDCHLKVVELLDGGAVLARRDPGGLPVVACVEQIGLDPMYVGSKERDGQHRQPDRDEKEEDSHSQGLGER